MTLQPFLDTSLAVQIHVVAAILAFLLGGHVLFSRKGDRRHRMAGMVWVALMVVTCVSSFFIHMIRLVGPWSPIHLLSIGTLVALAWAIRQARQRNIVSHRRTMQATYFGALIIAGSFTFMPGRVMHEVMFGGPNPVVGVVVAVVVVVVAAGAWVAWRGGAIGQYGAGEGRPDSNSLSAKQSRLHRLRRSPSPASQGRI